MPGVISHVIEDIRLRVDTLTMTTLNSCQTIHETSNTGYMYYSFSWL